MRSPKPRPRARRRSRPPPPSEPLPVLLAKADPAKGQAAAKKCQACHTFEKGGPNKVGPNLYGVVGGPKAHAQAFNYSAALKGKGGDWNFEELDKFIHNPKGAIPGTIMAFAGIPSADERAIPCLPAQPRRQSRSRCRRLERRGSSSRARGRGRRDASPRFLGPNGRLLRRPTGDAI